MVAAKANEVKDFVLYKKNNNLDQEDNLDDLPEAPAVYAISGRINGAPANCRHVGVTHNLRESVKIHFSDAEPDACLKQFMQSIKIKTLNYELLDEHEPQVLDSKKAAWSERFKPECNEALNEVF